MKRIKCSGVLWIGCALAAGCAVSSGSEQAGGEVPEGTSAESDAVEALFGGTRAPVAVCAAVVDARGPAPIWCEYRAAGNGTGCPADNDGAQVKFCIQQAGASCEMPTLASRWQINGTGCEFTQISYVASPGGCPNSNATYNFRWARNQLQACR